MLLSTIFKDAIFSRGSGMGAKGATRILNKIKTGNFSILLSILKKISKAPPRGFIVFQ